MFLDFSLSYYGPPIIMFCVFSHNVSIFSTLLQYLFFLLNNNVSIKFVNLIFWGASTRDQLTCFKDVTVYFLSISENVATVISPELSVLFLNKFVKLICQCQWLVTFHTPRDIFFIGVLEAVISWTSSALSMSPELILT